MNIIIGGAGRVGYYLAKNLSFKHNIILADVSQDRLNKVKDSLDILTLCGDIKDPTIYKKLDIKELELFIAVTDSDDANLLASLIVEDMFDIKTKIVRLKNRYFENSTVVKKLNIEHTIFPDILTAGKIESLFNFPKANNVKTFMQFNQKLISVKVHFDKDNTLNISNFTNIKVVVIERKNSLIIPKDDETLLEGDLIYLFGDEDEIKTSMNDIDCKMPMKIDNIVIFGANKSAQYIAKSLLKSGVKIKMIDKDTTLCQEASDFLEGRVRVINAVFDEHTLFDSENLKNADMIIAAYEDDEKNIVKCMESRVYNIEKVVAINNDKDYYSLMHQLGIVVVRGAKTATHYNILEKIASNSIITVSHFCGGLGVMFIRKIYPNSKLIQKMLKPLNIDNIKIFILRDDKIYEDFFPLKEDDSIVVFGKIEDEDEMQKWIYTL